MGDVFSQIMVSWFKSMWIGLPVFYTSSMLFKSLWIDCLWMSLVFNVSVDCAVCACHLFKLSQWTALYGHVT